MFQEFKAFVMRGNVMDLAVAVIIGGAFGTVVKSLVDDLLMPVMGLAAGGADFSNLYVILKDGVPAAPYASLAAAQESGAVTLNYGPFVNSLVAFVIVAAAIFAVLRMVNRLYRQPAETTEDTKPCPYCTMTIALAATRCPNCTSQL